mgnify:CR=1 FL=1
MEIEKIGKSARQASKELITVPDIRISQMLERTSELILDNITSVLDANAEDIKKAYGYFDPSYPTLADYVEIGNDVGLVPLSWKENILPDILRDSNVLSSLGVSELDSKEFQNAWMDIKHNRPDIRKRDLYPYSTSILFYKPPQMDQIDEPLLNSMKTPEFHYRPKGIFGKVLKSIAEKFFSLLFCSHMVFMEKHRSRTDSVLVTFNYNSIKISLANSIRSCFLIFL